MFTDWITRKKYVFDVFEINWKPCFKENVQEKLKGGTGWNLRISGVERYLLDIYLMFLSREIDVKLCQIYTKIHIFIFNKYATNLKTTISHRNLRIWGLLLLSFFNFYFAFLIAIIDNLITYSLYSPNYVTKTLANGSAVLLSRDTYENHVTSIQSL